MLLINVQKIQKIKNILVIFSLVYYLTTTTTTATKFLHIVKLSIVSSHQFLGSGENDIFIKNIY